MKRRKLPWIPCLLGAIVVGSGVGYWLSLPPGPFVPRLVHGEPPKYHFIRQEDQHEIKVWELHQSVDSVADELSHELHESDGWQPELVRRLSPKLVQFVRVHSPNGDFQFTRVTVQESGPNQSVLTVDLEPKQSHAFKR